MNTLLAPSAVRFFSFAKIGVRFNASLWLAMLLLGAAASIARGADIISTGPVSILKGSDAINPRPGTQGGGGEFNSLFYVQPGEGESPQSGRPSQHQLPNQPFYIAYEPTALPVQSNDWWTGVGLQWYVSLLDAGWAGSYNDGVIRSQGFISEPFYYQSVDFTGAKGSSEPPLPPAHGLRLWNQNAIAVKTDGKIKPNDPFNAANNIVDRALLAPEVQAVVTVGLEGAHPIGTTKPTNAPWTKVRARQYSDWGAVLAYKDGANEMQIHDGQWVALHLVGANTGTSKFSRVGRRLLGRRRCTYCVAESRYSPRSNGELAVQSG